MPVKPLLQLGIVLTLTACGDVVTSRYANMQEARNDELFQRGWLPDILPDSTTAIVTSNELDLNMSSGEFLVAPQDIGSFVDRLSGLQPPHSEYAGLIEGMQRRDYDSYTYTEGMTWLFLCNSETGHCMYRLPYSGLSR